MNEQEQLEEKVEETLATVLAEYYIRIPWQRVTTSNAHKYFVNNVRACAFKKNIKEFLTEFGEKIGTGFVRINATEILSFLNENNELVMDLLRKEYPYISNYALDIVDEIKEEKTLA